MGSEAQKLSRLEFATLSGLEDQSIAILAVGEKSEWEQNGHDLPRLGSIQFSSIEDVTEEILDRLRPSVVISPALSRRFDCIDLAQILCSYSYKGRYRAVSHELPNPTMVEREIRQLCPGLDFAILVNS